MNDGKNVLSLLGLALRGGRLAVGDEAAAQSAQGGTARLLLTASDAGEKTLRRARFLSDEGHCMLLPLPFAKTELGSALGRGTAAIVAVTDLGLAAAVTEKLALLDPEACGDAPERMRLKLRRAKERKEAPRKRPPPKDHASQPEDGSQRERRAGYGKPRSAKPDGRKFQGGKPDGRRPDGKKFQGGKPDGRKFQDGKPDGRRPDGRKFQGGKPDGGKFQGGKPDGRKFQGGKPDGRRPDGRKFQGGKPDGRRPDGGKSKSGRRFQSGKPWRPGPKGGGR